MAARPLKILEGSLFYHPRCLLLIWLVESRERDG